MRKSICLAVAGIALLAGSGFAADDSQAIRSVITKSYENWSAMNVDANDVFYAADAEAVWFDIAPLKYQSWAAYKAGVKKLFEGLDRLTIKPNDDMVIHQRGSVAWVVYTYSSEISLKGGRVESGVGRATDVLEKRGGKWIIVHEHASMPVSM